MHTAVLQECLYYSVPSKRPWVLNHKPSFFTILGACLVYWVLTVWKKIEMGGVKLWAWHLHARYACAHMQAPFRQSTRDTVKSG